MTWTESDTLTDNWGPGGSLTDNWGAGGALTDNWNEGLPPSVEILGDDLEQLIGDDGEIIIED